MSDALDSLGFALEESDTARATWRGTAEHLIKHYSGPLLAALAEAGVLTSEESPRIMGRNGRMTVVPPRRRYVTEWRPVDD